jgi:hypothetical protein
MTSDEFSDFCRRFRPLSFGRALRESELAIIAAMIAENLAVGMLQCQAQIRIGNLAPPVPPERRIFLPSRAARLSGSVRPS